MKWTTAYALLLVCGLSAAALAGPKAKQGAGQGTSGDTIKGRLTSIAPQASHGRTKLVITTGQGKRQQRTTVTADDRTEVTIKDQSANLSDLKVGQHLTITRASDRASAIQVDPGTGPSNKLRTEKKAQKRIARRVNRK